MRAVERGIREGVRPPEAAFALSGEAGAVAAAAGAGADGFDFDDSAKQFARIKFALKGSDGRSYRDFRATLTPRLHDVWTRLIAGYLALAAAMAAIALADRLSLALGLVLALPGAVVVGFVLHYLGLFLHAAGHYNLAPRPAVNDRLADIVLGVVLATDVASYRALHMKHHQLLGTHSDPENAYIHRPDWQFFKRWLTGRGTLEKLLRHRAMPLETARSFHGRAVQLASLVLHGAVVVTALLYSTYGAALAWTLGAIVMFPMFSDLRVILEHRSPEMPAGGDDRRRAHGAYSRLFRGGLVAQAFGAAGFVHHLLHHWEPAVPFERLHQLEAFLREAGLSEYLDSRTSTYPRAFDELVRAGGGQR